MTSEIQFYAHIGDPAASQHTLDQVGATKLSESVLRACWQYPGQWMSCREIAEDIFGMGPYSYEDAVALNKVQTAALRLYREHRLSRTVIDNVLHYRVGSHTPTP